jgi:serine phosphatase RsbU (regulator of sigma subunit)
MRSEDIDDRDVQELIPDNEDFRDQFVKPVAESLYHYVIKVFSSGNISSCGEFKKLSITQKEFWYSYAAGIPEKYKSLNLFIRSFKDFCRTPIITDNEIESLVNIDYGILMEYKLCQNGKDCKLLCTELNYFIPSELKKLGYEIFRREEVSEINNSMVRKLARAIHSKYLHEIINRSLNPDEINKNDPFKTDNKYSSDFDDLPEEIKNSNYDNASNIPAKLLSVGYKIRPVKKGFKPYALHLDDNEVETMAIVEHLRWSWEKRLNGWTYSPVRDDLKKTHPGLIPYDKLSEAEKDKDRELVKLIPAFLQDIDYEAYPVSPNRIKKLSYAIKPQSSINKILCETSALNEQIRSLVNFTPEIEEIVSTWNKKIEEAIQEIEGSYKYAQHIQETFLPDDFFVRESFPDSFILFKPKDIVSGDFYFFSRQNDLIIFAVADCTGHGIPGALLSTLGYGILDQAVNEIKLTEPSHILNHLYYKIHRFLRNDSEGNGIPDDMDIILCTLDTRTNMLKYAGVKNSLYCVSDGQLLEYEAQNSPDISTEDCDCSFLSTSIQLKISDSLYLCSDGYSDQFGGQSHKRYQTSRLKNLLLEIQSCSMSEQSDKLYEAIEKWREENNEDQTDDILILGIRI